jgi:hypothetical protein
MNDVAVAALLVLVETLVSTMFACRSPRRQMCAQRSVIGAVRGLGDRFDCFTNHNQGNHN